jgi:MFS family permease
MPSWLRAALPGTAAMLVGIGLCRFGYTPLIPFLIGEGLAGEAEAATLGAANVAGYLAGALLGAAIGRRFGPTRAIHAMLAASVAALALSAVPLGFWWLLPWRFLVGVTGAVLMVLGPSLIIARTAGAARGRTGGAIYTGVGVGAALSGIIVAPLASHAVAFAWLGLAALALAATLVGWQGWNGAAALPRVRRAEKRRPGRAVALLYVAYACDGAGFVPHTIFWVDFVARELGMGAAFGALNWVVFSLGAVTGPMAVGLLGDRIGIRRAVVATYAVKATAVALPLATAAPAALLLSILLVGALSPGISSLISARLAEIVAPAEHAARWGRATLVFSIAQAGSAAALSAAFAALGSYRPLFLAGALLLGIGTALAGAAALDRGCRPIEHRAT